MPSGLGRGLGSLIPNKVNPPTGVNQPATVNEMLDPRERIFMIAPSQILANSQQPRQEFDDLALKELSESIKEHGILQPLVVSQTDNGYQLVAGERRLRAAKLAKLKEVPVVLRVTNDEEHKLVLALIENIQRENLSSIEEAKAYSQMLDEYGVSHELLAKKVGKTRSHITNTLRLLKLPVEVQDALSKGQIGVQQAKLIAGMATKSEQMALLQNIIDNRLSKRAAIVEAQKMGGTKAAKVKYVPEDRDREASLAKALGSSVMIKRRKQGTARLMIDFPTDEELDKAIKKLK